MSWQPATNNEEEPAEEEEEEEQFDWLELRLGKRYRLIRKIGAGAFGDIYLGEELPRALKKKQKKSLLQNPNSNPGGFGKSHELKSDEPNPAKGKKVAVKIQPSGSDHPLLVEAEYSVYGLLENIPGVPHAHYYCKEKHKGITYHALVMDVLGPSVSDLYSFCGRAFSLQTTCQIAIQLLTRLEAIHQRGVVHRDLKPDNFLIGIGRTVNVIHLIDFGLARRYMVKTLDNASGEDKEFHIPQEKRSGESMTGTTRYGSINAHKHVTLSRRDDLESLAYVLLHWARPAGLPWVRIENVAPEQVYQMKLGTTIQSLCNGCPPEFEKFFKAIRALEYEERPNYNAMRGLFEIRLKNLGGTRDFDWTRKMNKSKKKKRQKLSHHHNGGPSSTGGGSSYARRGGGSSGFQLIRKPVGAP